MGSADGLTAQFQWSTDHYAKHRRLDAFEDVLQNFFLPLGAEWSRDSPVQARLTLAGTPDFSIGTAASTGLSAAVRGRKEIAGGNGYYIIKMPVNGTRIHYACERELTVNSGEMLVAPPDGKCRASFFGTPHANFKIWTIPRTVLDELAGTAGGEVAQVLRPDRGPGLLLGMYMRQLSDPKFPMDVITGDFVRRQLLPLVALAIGMNPNAMGLGREAERTAQSQRALGYVYANLHDPTLSPERVAAALGISTRQLQRFFQGMGKSFSKWLVKKRLHESYRLLTHASDMKIADVARTCGFTNLASFYRNFRAEFQMTPDDARNQPSDSLDSAPLGLRMITRRS